MKNQQTLSPSFALQIIPPIHANEEHTIALEATMQSLVLDRQHPIALELAGTVQRRRFIVRATSQAALDHVEALLHAQYSQCEIRPLPANDDPFRLDEGEAVTAVELMAGSASFLPLRTWQEAQKEGTDPLLSLLAAIGHLPKDTRAIAQLGLVPAEDNWSKRNLRRALENPVESEYRTKERQTLLALMVGNGSVSFGNIVLINVAIVAGFLWLIRSYIPKWVPGAIANILIGKWARLSAEQSRQLIIFAIVMLILEALIWLLYMRISRFFTMQALYDPHVVAQKVSRMVYRARLRLFVIGPKQDGEAQSIMEQMSNERSQANVREELLLRMVAAYRQFHMGNGAFFIPKHLSSMEVMHLLSVNGMGGAGWQRGLRNSRHLISVDALATLWHMPPPQALAELALVEHRRSRTLLIPPAVTRQCQNLPPIGYSEHAGYRLPFALTPEFFNFHTLVSGKAGEGKSTLIQHIAREAMRLGGLVLIDPFGDLCEKVLQLVPRERAEDVVFIDLSDTQVSVGLNPLDVTLGYERDKFITDLLKMLAQIWASSWTAKMENAFEMSLRTLFEANKRLIAQDAQRGPDLQYTLLDVLPLLTNVNFCHALLEEIPDDYLHRWWREYYEPLSLAQQRDVINPIATKVAKFESIIARRILGQGVSTLNIPRMIQERKIILFKLARGVVGNEVASMIGATLLGLIQNTLEEQGRQAHGENRRLPIIIDEFQRVAGADYRTLSELHKYGATFFLSTQSLEYLQKINPLLWPTLQANVRQFITFNMAAQDASLLSKELGVDQEDILHLNINTCYISIFALGTRQATFSLMLLPPKIINVEFESIRTRCRVRYTRPIAEVDKILSEAMLRSIRMVPQSNSQPSEQLTPLSEEAPRGEARHHDRRNQTLSNERVNRERRYQAHKDECNNQKDIHQMASLSTASEVLSQFISARGNSINESAEEQELREINEINGEEEHARNELDEQGESRS